MAPSTIEGASRMTNQMLRTSFLTVLGIGSLTLSACGELNDDAGTDVGAISTSQSAIFIGPSGHALVYFQCATEGGGCTVGGGKYLAYGANGKYRYRTSTGWENSAPCTSQFFGGDPAPNVAKKCYFANFSFPISEGSSSTSWSKRTIAYGAN